MVLSTPSMWARILGYIIKRINRGTPSTLRTVPYQETRKEGTGTQLVSVRKNLSQASLNSNGNSREAQGEVGEGSGHSSTEPLTGLPSKDSLRRKAGR